MFSTTSTSTSTSTPADILRLPLFRVDGNDTTGAILQEHMYGAILQERMYNELPAKLSINALLSLYGSSFFKILTEDLSYFKCYQFNDNLPVKQFTYAGIINSLLTKGSNMTVMQILGKVAEALVVKFCKTSQETNRHCLATALHMEIYEISLKEVNNCKAIGTGLKSTKLNYPNIYCPQHPQLDIAWINLKNNKLICRIADAEDNENFSVLSSADIIGLQIKTSMDGKKNVLDNILNDVYQVPIIYFGVKDDCSKIEEKIYEHKLLLEKSGQPIPPHLLDTRYIIRPIQEINHYCYDEFMADYELLKALQEHRISVEDFVFNCAKSVNLEKSILSFSLPEDPGHISIEDNGCVIREDNNHILL